MVGPITVRVPASTSNLGGGFDTVGLAVRLYLTVRFEPGGDGLTIRREGALAALEDVPPSDDLVLRSFRAELARRGGEGVRGLLVADSEIPIGRGLGTSAAAVVAGLVLAAAVAGDTDPDREALLQYAARVEGHGDNAAPALLGGLVTVAPTPEGTLRAFRFPLSHEISFVFAAPPVSVSTEEARRVLPAEYARATSVAALGRLAALLHGLSEGAPDALRIGMQDSLHVPYRLPLVPGAANAMSAAREAGAWGATLSGSGSGVIAVCVRGRVEAVMDAMAAAFQAVAPGVRIAFPLEPDQRGALLLGDEPVDPIVAEHEA